MMMDPRFDPFKDVTPAAVEWLARKNEQLAGLRAAMDSAEVERRAADAARWACKPFTPEFAEAERVYYAALDRYNAAKRAYFTA